MKLNTVKTVLVLSLLVLSIQSLFAEEPAVAPGKAPSGLTAVSLSASGIVISWTDNSNNETGFIIERKNSITGTYTAIITPTANTTVYTDTALSQFTLYYYRITAYNAAGNSAYSNEASAVTFNQATSGKMILQWKAEGANLKVRVSAKDSGWVAVGFNKSGHKKGANIIIGYVKNNKLFIQDAYGTTVTTHASDTSLGGTDNITDKSGTESDGTTELIFTIPLDSGDDKDIPLVVGKTYTALLACSKSDNFTGIHTFVRTIKIKIQ